MGGRLAPVIIPIRTPPFLTPKKSIRNILPSARFFGAQPSCTVRFHRSSHGKQLRPRNGGALSQVY